MMYFQCDRCGKKALDRSEGRTYISILSYNDALSYNGAHGMSGIWLCKSCQEKFERSKTFLGIAKAMSEQWG